MSSEKGQSHWRRALTSAEHVHASSHVNLLFLFLFLFLHLRGFLAGSVAGVTAASASASTAPGASACGEDEVLDTYLRQVGREEAWPVTFNLVARGLDQVVQLITGDLGLSREARCQNRKCKFGG